MVNVLKKTFCRSAGIRAAIEASACRHTKGIRIKCENPVQIRSSWSLLMFHCFWLPSICLIFTFIPLPITTSPGIISAGHAPTHFASCVTVEAL